MDDENNSNEHMTQGPVTCLFYVFCSVVFPVGELASESTCLHSHLGETRFGAPWFFLFDWKLASVDSRLAMFSGTEMIEECG